MQETIAEQECNQRHASQENPERHLVPAQRNCG
jgi:hypothetical protein